MDVLLNHKKRCFLILILNASKFAFKSCNKDNRNKRFTSLLSDCNLSIMKNLTNTNLVSMRF